MEGKKFGKWEVLNQISWDKPGKYYECICECGKISVKKGTELRAGRGLQCSECMYAELYDPQREIGKRYGKWTIMEYIGMHRNLQQYKVQCDCGTNWVHVAADLRAKKTLQCITCHNRENAKKLVKHGMHNTPIYKVWSAMIQRCNNPKASSYYRYGARGIKVCERWESSFENFYEDMGDRPEKMDIDRIDNNGNYEPSNCRWVSHKENCRNRKY